MSKYTDTPHQTIEQICATAQRRVAAGEQRFAVVKDLVEGYDLGWGSANAQAIDAAAGLPFNPFPEQAPAVIPPLSFAAPLLPADVSSPNTYTPDDAPDPDKAAPIAAYEAKQQAKVERLEAAADAHASTANHLHDRAHKMADVIPFGQPILVGHYSEHRDRNYRARISSTFDKAREEQDKADYYAQRAASAANNTAIRTEDPAADDKLRAKIADAEALQEAMKACNAAIRKHAKAGPAAQIAALVALGRTEAQAVELLKPDFCGRIGFADYQLTNNGANIRRMKQRLEHVTQVQATPATELQGTNARFEDCPQDNRVRLFFPGKPSVEVRSRLKSSGFRWAPSEGAWQAYRNYHTLETAKREAGLPAETPTAPPTQETPDRFDMQVEDNMRDQCGC